MFDMFALLLDDALKPATPLKFAPLLSGVTGLSAELYFRKMQNFSSKECLASRN